MDENAAGTAAAVAPVHTKPERAFVWMYAALWLGLIGVSAYLLGPWSTAQGTGVEYYRILLASGFVLTVSGPVFALLAWLIVRHKVTMDEPQSLFGRIMLKTIGAGLLGAVSWTLMLPTLDYMRTGLG
ncbi:MAG: hypothetical protein M1617_06825 [Actinobacteria bacterium]|nr:hypothetical protein [Actinomycetota bacterium]MCL5887983.1 hypothetical protein [Actinomycetota bacterium]